MTEVLEEKVRAQEELLVAIQAYELASSLRRAALGLHESHPCENTKANYVERLNEETEAGAKVNKALKRMNALEGKKTYDDREVEGVRWRPSGGNLPHRY